MKPYYEDSAVTIYHGDCREILPELKADLVLTDPPYGLGFPYLSYQDSPEALVELIKSAFPMFLLCAPLVAISCGIQNLQTKSTLRRRLQRCDFSKWRRSGGISARRIRIIAHLP